MNVYKTTYNKALAVMAIFMVLNLHSSCLLGVVSVAHAEVVNQNYLSHNSTHDFVDAPHLPYANPDAPKTGTLSLQQLGTFNSANKWLPTGNAMAGTGYLYDNLMTSSLDEAYTMYPQLADYVVYDTDDYSWIIFHINPRAKFWDGSSVTAEDVEATFDALLSKGPMSIRNFLSNIKSLEVIDKHQIKFIFKEANKEALLAVSQFPVFAKKSIEVDFEKLTLQPLMGSGAYQLHDVNQGRSVTYQLDPNYWGKDLMVNRGRYNFEFIKYVYYQDDDIGFEGFKAGMHQFREETKIKKWVKEYDFAAKQNNLVVTETIDLYNPVAMSALVMNQRKNIFKDIKVRQALTLAFDFEWLNAVYLHNQSKRLQSFFYHSELAAQNTPSVSEQHIINQIKTLIPDVQYQYVVQDWQLPKSNADGYNRKNLLHAQQLLKQAGWYYKDMQLYMPNDKPAMFEVLLSTADIQKKPIILSYVRNLKRLGFQVNIRQIDIPQYTQRVREYDFDMIFDVFFQGSSPGPEQLAYWSSDSANQIGNLNTAGIQNKAIDAVIEKLISANSREDIVLHTKVLDRLLRAGFYMVPLYGNGSKNVAYWHQYKHTRLPKHTIGLDYWWADIDAEK